jgi:hypothetical protein
MNCLGGTRAMYGVILFSFFGAGLDDPGQLDGIEPAHFMEGVMPWGILSTQNAI